MNKRQVKKNLLKKPSNRYKVKFWIKTANNYRDKLLKTQDARDKAIDKSIELAIEVGRLKRQIISLEAEREKLKNIPWWKKAIKCK